MTDKQKRIIAYIIAIWFAVFGSIGMVQTGLNIANCAGRKKQVKQAYAADSNSFSITLTQLSLYGDTTAYTLGQDIIFNIATNGITISSTNSNTPLLITYEQEFEYWLNDVSFYKTDTLPAQANETVNRTIICKLENNIREIAYGTYGANITPNAATIEFIEYGTTPLPNNTAGAKITATDGTNDIYIYLWTYDDQYQITQFLTTTLNTGTEYNTGYNVGYKAGTNEKELYGITQYNRGKSDGIASANNYSFKSLISAVFDVPVQTLYGMLNFNILDINILSFVMSIISVILLITIVKVFL